LAFFHAHKYSETLRFEGILRGLLQQQFPIFEGEIA
jgi:hypothetical protein